MTTDTKTSTEKLGLDVSAETRIADYVNIIYNEYEVPIDGIKEIPLNLKGNEKYFAVFYYGTIHSDIFFKMTDEQKTICLSHLVEELKVSNDTLDYLVTNIITTGYETKFSIDDIIKIINNKFTEKEKYYMLFSYGLLFKYK